MKSLLMYHLLTTVALACAAPADATYELIAVNLTNSPVKDYSVAIRIKDLPEKYHKSALSVIDDSGNILVSQVDDLNGDGVADELVFLSNIPAGRGQRFNVIKRPTEKATTDLQVDDDFTFRNDFFVCKARTDIAVKNELYADGLENLLDTQRVGVQIIDSRSGTEVIEGLWLALPEKSKPTTRIVAAGPVRTVVEHSYFVPSLAPKIDRLGSSVKSISWDNAAADMHEIKVTQRYILAAHSNCLEFEIVLQNLSDRPQKVAGISLVQGKQGELLTKDIRNTAIFSVNRFRCSRNNLIWINPATDYATGVTFHSPCWYDYGYPLWAPPYLTYEGLYVHADGDTIHSRPVEPGEERRVNCVRKDDRIFLGNLSGFPKSKNKAFFRRFGKDYTPFEIPAKGSRTLGFTLYSYRQSGNTPIHQFEKDSDRAVGVVNVCDMTGKMLVKANAPYYIDESFDSPDRWMTDESARLTVHDGIARIMTDETDSGIWTAFCRDFDDPTELRGHIHSISGQTALRLILEHIEDGELYNLGTVQDDFCLNLDDLPLRSVRNCILRLELITTDGAAESMDEPLTVEIKQVTLGWPIPAAPTVQSPMSGFPLSDMSVGVGICSETREQCERGYQLQFAGDASFESIKRSYRFSNPIRITTSRSEPHRTLTPMEALPMGDYYCRVRAIGILEEPGPWSESRQFEVASTDYTPKPPVRSISQQQPLFIIPNLTQELWDSLPEEVRPLTVAEVGIESIKDNPKHYLKGTKYPILAKISHSTSGLPDLSYLEYLFANHSKVIGWWYPEAHYPPGFAGRNLNLAAKYGRFTGRLSMNHYGHAGHGANQEFYELLKTHGQYFLPADKSQNPYAPFECYVNLLGLWLAGRPPYWGVETEWGMAWKLRTVQRPRENVQNPTGKRDPVKAIDWMPPFLFGLAYGAQVYRTEAFVGGKLTRGWDKKNNKFDVLWWEAIGPFYEDILKYDLIPSREDILANCKVAFQPKAEAVQPQPRGVEAYPYHIIDPVHNLDTHWYQWVPNNPRYGIIPMLPVHATENEKARFQAVVDPSEYASAKEAKEFLDRFYPPVKTEAFTVLNGDTGVITNSEERAIDVQIQSRERAGSHWFGPVDFAASVEPQYFHMEFSKGPVHSIEGKVDYHQYLILKQQADMLFIHANNYEHKQTTFSLIADRPLNITVEPTEALVIKGHINNSVTIKLSHRHREHVVRVFVK